MVMLMRPLLIALLLPVLGAVEHLTTAPVVHVPRAETAPVIEAAVDGASWAGAAVIDVLPASEGMTEPTTVRLLWDQAALYVRFEVTDDEAFTPYAGQRDADHFRGDVAEVFIDPIGDARQYYEVQLTPAGDVLDLNTVLSAPAEADERGVLRHALIGRELWKSRGFDLRDLRVAAGPSADGWIAELAIPAGALMRRHGGGPLRPLTLRANLARYEWALPIDDDGQRQLIPMYWAPVPTGVPHLAPLAMGQLILSADAARPTTETTP